MVEKIEHYLMKVIEIFCDCVLKLYVQKSSKVT